MLPVCARIKTCASSCSGNSAIRPTPCLWCDVRVADVQVWRTLLEFLVCVNTSLCNLNRPIYVINFPSFSSSRSSKFLCASCHSRGGESDFNHPLKPNQIINRHIELFRASDPLQRFADDFDVVVEAAVRWAFGPLLYVRAVFSVGDEFSLSWVFLRFSRVIPTEINSPSGTR